jgi:hypothetical protein
MILGVNDGRSLIVTNVVELAEGLRDEGVDMEAIEIEWLREVMIEEAIRFDDFINILIFAKPGNS